uniref:Fibronectin type-III domain-containing protein n=1 Tax=Paramormyrops kingsleyae TaxID=1676925 RepID=A0A3B3QNN6_9TELE
MTTGAIQIAALGRPLHPGMLYDCRNDGFIAGVTFWDAEDIEKNMSVHEQNQSKSHITASDSLSKKSSLLDVSASLKASFLAGLVEIGGSAKYLKDTVTTESQCRVTMHYSQKTVFKQLNMKNIGKVTYADVIKQGTATHVVTGVLYGVDTFMVFDQTVSQNEYKQDIQDKLNKIQCTFYGDVILKENPTTYLEAVKVYKDLPKLLEHRAQKAVPVTVWLYPLKYFDNKAAKLVQEISENLIIELDTILEDLQSATATVNELLQISLNIQATDIQDKLKTFQDMLRQYQITVQKNVSEIIPSIRNGKMDENKLVPILESHYNSPFTAKIMSKWLEKKRSELEVLRSYIDTFENQKNIQIVSPTQYNGLIFSPDNESVVAFVFTSLKYEEPYILYLTKCLNSKEFMNKKKFVEDEASTPWFLTPDISQTMRENYELFKQFSDANKEEEKSKFVITYISDLSHPGASIYLHREGKLVDSQYKPILKPDAPLILDIGSSSITLKLQASPASKPMRFRVEIKEKNGGQDWRIIDTQENQENWIISGLQPDTVYLLRYRAVDAGGVSEPSNDVTIHTKGLTTYKFLGIYILKWTVNTSYLVKKAQTFLLKNTQKSQTSHSALC